MSRSFKSTLPPRMCVLADESETTKGKFIQIKYFHFLDYCTEYYKFQIICWNFEYSGQCCEEKNQKK